jgi:hypothetical protein
MLFSVFLLAKNFEDSLLGTFVVSDHMRAHCCWQFIALSRTVVPRAKQLLACPFLLNMITMMPLYRELDYF